MTQPRVAVLAQDLIWGDRLARAVKAAGAEPVRVTGGRELDAALVDADHAIVDLVARAYDPVAAITRARSAGARVLAVGPHDDLPLRKLALGAGAERVLAYRKLFEDGPGTLSRWLSGDEPASKDDATAGIATRVTTPR